MRCAIIIPARMQATRLPGKPLAMLGNVPLVVRVAQQATKCPGIDLVAIATDSPAVYDAALSHGVQAVMTAAHHTSGTDRVAEAAEQLDASDPLEWVINVQGDEPFVDPRDLQTLTHALRGPQAADMVTLKRPLSDPSELQDPSCVKVVTRNDGMALYFSRAAIPFARGASDALTGTFRHIGVYGFRRRALRALCAAPPHFLEIREGLEQLRALAIGLSIAVLPAHTEGRGIDTEEDLAWARTRVARLGEAAFATPEHQKETDRGIR